LSKESNICYTFDNILIALMSWRGTESPGDHYRLTDWCPHKISYHASNSNIYMQSAVGSF